MSYKQPQTDELLLEVIKERLSPDFKRPHDHKDITKEELILEVIRQVETDAYNYGVMEIRQAMKKVLGYDIPKNGWPKVPDLS